MIVRAHAKINLTLELLGKRADGYHELRSIVMPIALHDELDIRFGAVQENAQVTLEVVADGVDCSQMGVVEDNLCVKAIRNFYATFSTEQIRQPEIAIRIIKRIPLGGGMGGGSADAAATLQALAQHHAFSEEREGELLAVAAQTGSDVPALLLAYRKKCAVKMEGRGERVMPLQRFCKAFTILLANPGTHVSTAAAFRAADLELTNSQFSDKIGTSQNCLESLSKLSTILSNGLEKPVFTLYPEIAHIAARLRRAGARGVLMSGSGATVFALVESSEEAVKIAQALPVGCWWTISQLMPDGVTAAHGPLEA